jgi:hypothetical protein
MPKRRWGTKKFLQTATTSAHVEVLRGDSGEIWHRIAPKTHAGREDGTEENKARTEPNGATGQADGTRTGQRAVATIGIRPLSSFPSFLCLFPSLRYNLVGC